MLNCRGGEGGDRFLQRGLKVSGMGVQGRGERTTCGWDGVSGFEREKRN